MSKVERTKPGSKLHFVVTYDSGSKKWTNDRPGDNKGDSREKRKFFRDLTVKRGIKRLEKAIDDYANGEGTEKGIRSSVDVFEQYSGREDAKMAVRAVFEAVSEVGGKLKEGAGIAKDYVNRGRKTAMNERQIARDLVRIARVLMGNSMHILLRKGLEKYLEENGEFEMDIGEIEWGIFGRGTVEGIRNVTFFPSKVNAAKFLDSLGFDRGDMEKNLDEVLNSAFRGANIEFKVPVTIYNEDKAILEREMLVEVTKVTYRNGTLVVDYKVDKQNVMDIIQENLEAPEEPERDWYRD